LVTVAPAAIAGLVIAPGDVLHRPDVMADSLEGGLVAVAPS
jgi:hypothetical protein